jgi:hypothetical protein
MSNTTKKARFLREIADHFSREKGLVKYDAGEVVDWAMARGDLDLSPAETRKILIGQMSSALREDTTTDRNGNKVRLRYNLQIKQVGPDGKVVQRFLWAHVDDADDVFLIESFRQMKAAIEGDVVAYRANAAFVCERRKEQGKREIQFPLDFWGDSSASAEGG